jgi:hypothetical protein
MARFRCRGINYSRRVRLYVATGVGRDDVYGCDVINCERDTQTTRSN